jgi:ribosomal protein S18 acetylase RimI-like enzyme
MKPTISNLSSDELLSSMESNLVAFWSPYGRAKGSAASQDENVYWYYTGIMVSIANGVLYARLDPEDVEAVVRQLQAQIEARDAPVLWWISPLSTPANIGSLLARYGLQAAGEVPGMALDLNELDEDQNQLDDFEIRLVDSIDLQETWARVAGIGTGFPDAAVEAFSSLEASLSNPQYRAQFRYIGYLEGNPVAASAMALDSGVAGIYAVATLPQARRKGIGRLMTVLPLLDARRHGYRTGVLQASSMGFPIYQKIGFRQVCKFDLYLQEKNSG